MKINDVKTAFKIADVAWDGTSTKLEFKYLETLYNENSEILPKSILTQNVARVYLIVVNGEVYKIGGSHDKGGIKKTLRIYQDGGVNGRPSIRSFGIWYYLFHAIMQGKTIEFYMIYQDNFNAQIKGLFGYHEVEDASYDYKLLENCCIQDYLNSEGGKHPQWNVQEQAGDWPEDIKSQHAKILDDSLNRTTKKGRIRLSI